MTLDSSLPALARAGLDVFGREADRCHRLTRNLDAMSRAAVLGPHRAERSISRTWSWPTCPKSS